MQFARYKKIDFSQLFLYFLFAFSSVCLYFTGNNGEPFPLALSYALIPAGIPPAICAIIGVFPSFFSGNAFLIFLYIAQHLLLLLGFFLQKRFRQTAIGKINLLPFFTLFLSLIPFVFLAPFHVYPLPFPHKFLNDSITQKVFFASIIFLLSAIFSIAIKALLHKLLKCRLRNDEIVFNALFFVLIGMGMCRFLSVNAYMGASFFILLLYSLITKDASPLLCAFLLSLPPALIARLSPERFFVYGTAIVLFSKAGRLASASATLIVFFIYGYFDGLYTFETSQLIQSVLSVVIPTLLFILLPSPLVRQMENKLIFYREKHLSRIAINRNRAAIGEKLFEISGVFREIETTFTSLGSNEAEESAKEYICSCVQQSVCKKCPHYSLCPQKDIQRELGKLIDVGCLKGRVNFIDMPRLLVDVCFSQNEILECVNHLIGDYRKYMIETENATSGRMLLANQAHGVSEILKNLALEQSEPLRIYTDKERALTVALLSAGIVCSEVLIYGEEDNFTVSLITFGNTNIKRITAVVSDLAQTTMIASEKISLSQNKYCYILKKKPYFDAAFGVASKIKKGQSASGDTHSVIKIDERRFMVALSDGMGSGEYARRISESTISLLESFYRAKMPSDLVLSTINKLLTFNKEETFACVDIAVVNLDSGIADIVKIGSPYGFIISENAVKVLEGTSLPLGILDSLHPDTASYTLSENDVLLFLSDGITDAFGSTADLCDILKSSPANNPQQLVDTLLARAMESYENVAKDDMTAIAVRLFRSIDLNL